MYSVVGNKKKVTMDYNVSRLKVVGNNCIVKVTTNHGDIEVIGNDCKVEIGDNYGSFSIVGGNGLVTILKRYPGDRALLVGPGTYMVADGQKKSSGCDTQLSPFTKDLDDMIESIFGFVMR